MFHRTIFTCHFIISFMEWNCKPRDCVYISINMRWRGDKITHLQWNRSKKLKLLNLNLTTAKNVFGLKLNGKSIKMMTIIIIITIFCVAVYECWLFVLYSNFNDVLMKKGLNIFSIAFYIRWCTLLRDKKQKYRVYLNSYYTSPFGDVVQNYKILT